MHKFVNMEVHHIDEFICSGALSFASTDRW